MMTAQVVESEPFGEEVEMLQLKRNDYVLASYQVLNKPENFVFDQDTRHRGGKDLTTSSGNLTSEVTSYDLRRGSSFIPQQEDHPNLSVAPSSMHIPASQGAAQYQTSIHQHVYYYQQSGSASDEYSVEHREAYSKQHTTPQAPALRMRPDQSSASVQQQDNIPHRNRGNRKVFILHSIPENDPHNDALLLFASELRDAGVNISVDLFKKDKSKDNWSMWYEQEILSSDIVLCIITPNFYKSITEDDRIKGYALYNLMNDSSKDIVFRAVFLDAPKVIDYIPLSMRGATCYCIKCDDLRIPENDEFTNLYAFLTGQNRVEKPKLGKVITLTPKRSRFGQNRTNRSAAAVDTWQRRPEMNTPQSAVVPTTTQQTGSSQAKLIYDLLGNDTTQVQSLRSHQRMIAMLASNIAAEWEILGRMLNIGESSLHAIKRDHRDSVREQAAQVLRMWIDVNGSAATLGALTTVLYELGPNYWNLLYIVNKHAPK